MTGRTAGALLDRVLITGGAGLIGSHIADELVRAGATEIVILDDFSRGTLENVREASASGRVRMIEGDVRDRATVDRAMEGVTLVFHEAGIRITQCAEKPRLANEVLVDGTFNVLEAAASAFDQGRRRVDRIGLRTRRDVSDRRAPSSVTPNRTLYGAAKVYNEGCCAASPRYGLDYIALRYFNVYGPRMDVYGVYTKC
jgi:UDP-glucose 4-epimerase